jgi:GT2 family glycosyltransferase
MIREHIPEFGKAIFRRLRASVLSVGLSRTAGPLQSEGERAASEKISVIVPIHDAVMVTKRCLSSLEHYGGDAEIVLVDDGSRLEETNLLLDQYVSKNKWLIVRHETPLGHSQSCRDGAEAACRPYLCFLNSDTVVTPCSWSSATQAFDADHRIVATGPSTSHSATIQTVRRAHHCRHYWTNQQIYAFAQKYASRVPPNTWVDVPILGGFAFFVRHDTWNECGGFDSALPDYGNESELCRRLQSQGFRIVWTRNGYIHHIGEGSYKDVIGRAEIRRRQVRGRAYIQSTHGEVESSRGGIIG